MNIRWTGYLKFSTTDVSKYTVSVLYGVFLMGPPVYVTISCNDFILALHYQLVNRQYRFHFLKSVDT